MAGLTPHPWIETLDVYEGGKSKADGATKVVKLSSNETPFGPSPKAIAAYQDAATTLHRYPDATAAELRAAIGALHGHDPKQIVCGLGSDEILKLAVRAYAGPGDEVLFSRHSFAMYPIAAMGVGATPVEVPDRELTADVDAILEHVSDRTRVIFVANPNNPTGTYLPKSEVERLMAGLPDNVLLVLDAAYDEYADAPDYMAPDYLVPSYPNLLVTRTFSKIYGIAALRLGWGYGQPELISILDRSRDPFNLPTTTQQAGIAAILDQDWIAMSKAHNRRWRDWLNVELTALGLTVVPSQANFILIRFPETAAPDGQGSNRMAEGANAFLLRHGYILRWLPKQGLGDCLRLTIGLEDDNRAVVDLIKRFLQGERA
ncbi:histidinol-phosphate transaminase [Govanella unica]|uniref:Histidinol-phosphate aminotransferase n=1 Tax=Govanella unica TaxID=2975056 RepID=A0A9X3TVV7_9PROT|nr:histidinol-phosphate transaminase [Govania unica]MDA5192608.1 histidinol-phosphate transaminase [Govania unica]